MVSAHLPHYPQTQTLPGQVLADALEGHAASAGTAIQGAPLLIMGDFNEFAECSLPPVGKCSNDRYAPAKPLIEPLWSYLGYSNIADAVSFNVTTCCTKWSDNEKVKQQSSWNVDWHHHFDQLYFTPNFFSASTPEFIEYSYPGESKCKDAACTGDAPEEHTVSQGSWHRGWQATFTFAEGDMRNVEV